MVTPAELDELMHHAWPGLATHAVDGWIARLGGGITQRANSVFPRRAPVDIERALETVQQLYHDAGLTPTFQISAAAQPARLDAMLAERGYELRAPTLVLTAPTRRVLATRDAPAGPVAIDDRPGETWTRLWWSLDGRGGEEALPVVRRLLTACPAIYLSLSDSTGLAAVGRLALVDGWGGIYCMAVRPDARRRGHGTAIVRALAEEAARHSITHLWLQVVEDNRPARALYERSGFRPASRYHYRALT